MMAVGLFSMIVDEWRMIVSYYKSTTAVVSEVFWQETEKRVVQISKLLHYSSRDTGF
jgi:hypothetical protein